MKLLQVKSLAEMHSRHLVEFIIQHPSSMILFISHFTRLEGVRAEVYVKPFVVAASARVSVRFEAAEWEISLPSLSSLRFRIII